MANSWWLLADFFCRIFKRLKSNWRDDDDDNDDETYERYQMKKKQTPMLVEVMNINTESGQPHACIVCSV